MTNSEDFSAVLTDVEFERKYGDTSKGGEGTLLPDAEDADSFNGHSGSSPPDEGGNESMPETLDAEDRRLRLGTLWGDFSKRTFQEAEKILFGMRRGNVGLLIAETDIGKTTFALNISLTLAADRTFHPFVTERRGGLRVMFVDGESTRAEFKEAVSIMMQGWSESERALVEKNLLVLCDEQLRGELLDLADGRHMALLRDTARAFRPDLIVIDTMAALFNLADENSNPEVKRVVMQPLKMLARAANGAVWLAHHIGKSKGEEGSINVHAYKGRGASNFGGLSRSVITLHAPDRSDKQRVILSVQKAKGYRLRDVVMRLDDNSRWFTVTDETPPASTTCLQAVRAFVQGEIRTGAIVEGMKEQGYSRSAVEAALKDAVTRKLLRRPRQGWYAPLETT